MRDLLVMRVGALGRDVRAAMHRLEVNPTEVGRAGVTHAPPLTLQPPLHGFFRPFAAFHQGPSARGELLPALRAAQPVNLLVLAGP